MSKAQERSPPFRSNRTPRYLAGVAPSFQLSEEQCQLLQRRGAEVIQYRERVGILTLAIADVHSFMPPGFIRFLVPDEEVEASEE